ncbi:MAG: hypothetical protein AB7F35_28285, partial [Acetobacteraceae bacterium]
QAIHLYLGWDRPAVYSLFMLPLHLRLTTWPVVVAQALIAVLVLRLLWQCLAPGRSWAWMPGVCGFLAIGTWFPWTVSELMPDLFTPLLVLLLAMLIFADDRLSVRERAVAVAATAFMIATQLSSVALAGLLIPLLFPLAWWLRRRRPGWDAPVALGLAALVLVAANLAGHGRASVSPYGNVFLLARLLDDGPAASILRRDCPDAGWRLCPWADRFPMNSDDFLWRADSPVVPAGGHKGVSADADAILAAAWDAEPGRVLAACLANTWQQMVRFASGDGLEPWPDQVSPHIIQDFPAGERAAYLSARQQTDALAVPAWLAVLHRWVAVAGIAACILSLPVALRRSPSLAGVMLTVLLALPVSAAVTGALSAPHDRYQSRVAWLPACVALVGFASRPQPQPQSRLRPSA